MKNAFLIPAALVAFQVQAAAPSLPIPKENWEELVGVLNLPKPGARVIAVLLREMMVGRSKVEAGSKLLGRASEEGETICFNQCIGNNGEEISISPLVIAWTDNYVNRLLRDHVASKLEDRKRADAIRDMVNR